MTKALRLIGRLPLLVKILVAMALGIGLGHVMPLGMSRVFITFNALFSQFLGFLIPLIIVGFVAPAIADTGRKAGKILLATAGVAYMFTLMAAFISFFAGSSIFPHLINPGSLHLDTSGSASLTPYFTIEMPPLFSVTSALVLAFVAGLGMTRLNSTKMRDVADELRQIIEKTIASVIIPLLPIYIFGVFVGMIAEGQISVVLGSFIKIIGVIIALHIVVLLIQFTIAGIVTRRNPLRLLLTMMPAYFTALGTQSSAATIPVTLKQALKTGANEEIAGFVVPLCATIHLSGSALKVTACALAMMIMTGMPFDFGMFAGFIMMLGVTMVAAPGVPGGAIMAALGLLSSMLGFTDAMQGIIIALYIAMDSFGTATNVTGDGSITLIINKLFSRRQQPSLAA